jgi:hypothetical protein
VCAIVPTLIPSQRTLPTYIEEKFMADDTVQTSWKRFTDRVKGAWLDHYYDNRASEPVQTPAQQRTEGPALPQSTKQNSRSPDA